MPKVVDTFLFSEPFEDDLLWLKLYHEYPIVDKFIGIESAYTFRGQHKGVCLEKVLQQPRFKPFAHKVKVISILENRCLAQNENEYCRVSDTQRGFAESYIFSRYEDDDFVIISDVDEFIDGRSASRKAAFEQLLTHKVPLDIERLRYWYDIDNVGTFEPMEISLPVVPLLALKTKYMTWKDRKFKGEHVRHNDKDYLVFEYSSVFTHDGIIRKHLTFAHDGFSEEDIRRGLYYNSWPIQGGGLPNRNDKHRWFETVPLNAHNSPQYLIDNYHLFKTHSVNSNYKENRTKLWEAQH